MSLGIKTENSRQVVHSVRVKSETPTLITKSIIQNGTYLASGDNADGYDSVTVNVAPTLISKSIIQNGTYLASSDNVDGYNSVTVNVAPDVTLDDFVMCGGRSYRHDSTWVPKIYSVNKNANKYIWSTDASEIVVVSKNDTTEWIKSGLSLFTQYKLQYASGNYISFNGDTPPTFASNGGYGTFTLNGVDGLEWHILNNSISYPPALSEFSQIGVYDIPEYMPVEKILNLNISNTDNLLMINVGGLGFTYVIIPLGYEMTVTTYGTNYRLNFPNACSWFYASLFGSKVISNTVKENGYVGRYTSIDISSLDTLRNWSSAHTFDFVYNGEILQAANCSISDFII